MASKTKTKSIKDKVDELLEKEWCPLHTRGPDRKVEGIYVIKHGDNYYVGRSHDIKRRLGQHDQKLSYEKPKLLGTDDEIIQQLQGLKKNQLLCLIYRLKDLNIMDIEPDPEVGLDGYLHIVAEQGKRDELKVIWIEEHNQENMERKYIKELERRGHMCTLNQRMGDKAKRGKKEKQPET